ncbi:hypothetical protein [Geminisphaera colitermitum]|uniref:hypothetical protein n=1 Tax=Geminisphaera colitermitum TaxID=1148786 RepID=UPI0012FED036|nr:hypothetical protein [Geminisphaera colitermitum]
MSEYSCPLQTALDFPLAQAFALYAAISARYGNKPKGPTYVEKAQIAQLTQTFAP